MSVCFIYNRPTIYSVIQLISITMGRSFCVSSNFIQTLMYKWCSSMPSINSTKSKLKFLLSSADGIRRLLLFWVLFILPSLLTLFPCYSSATIYWISVNPYTKQRYPYLQLVLVGTFKTELWLLISYAVTFVLQVQFSIMCVC